jgi:hypothetical protein
MTLRVPPAGDVVDGAQRQVEPELSVDRVGDRLGDNFADVPRHLSAGVVRHRVGEDGGKVARGDAGQLGQHQLQVRGVVSIEIRSIIEPAV